MKQIVFFKSKSFTQSRVQAFKACSCWTILIIAFTENDRLLTFIYVSCGLVIKSLKKQMTK